MPFNHTTTHLVSLCLLLALAGACDDTRYSSAIVEAGGDNPQQPDPDGPGFPGPDDDPVVDDPADPEPEPEPEPQPDNGWMATGPLEVTEGRVQVFGQLLWTEKRFAAVWIQNPTGHLFVVVSFIDPDTMMATEPVRVSEDYDLETLDQTPGTVYAVWTGAELALVWATPSGLWMRRMNADGGLIGAQRRVVGGTGPHTQIQGVVMRPDGRLGVVWTDDRFAEYGYLPYYAAISLEGDEVVEDHAPLVEGESNTFIGSVSEGRPDPCDCNDRWHYEMSWKRWDGPGDPDVVKLTTFDQDGQVVSVQNTFEGDTVHLAFRGESITGGVEVGPTIGVWDVDLGTFLIHVGPDGPVQIYLREGGDRPSLARGERFGLGVLVDAGSLFVEGDGVLFYPASSTGDLVAGPLMLPATMGRTVQGYTIAGGGGGYGVLTDDSGALNFSMLRPLAP